MERGTTGPAAEAVAAPVEKDLRARAAWLADRYEALAAQAESAAVRWRWATPTSGRADVEPLRLERMGRRPGRWLRRRPRTGEHEAVGFDADDRVVCVRQLDDAGVAWLASFARWSPAEVELACYRPPLAALPAQLQRVTVVRLESGRPVACARYLPPTGRAGHERYGYEGERLARVEEDGVVKEVVYGGNGRVAGVDVVGAEGRAAVWRAPSA